MLRHIAEHPARKYAPPAYVPVTPSCAVTRKLMNRYRRFASLFALCTVGLSAPSHAQNFANKCGGTVFYSCVTLSTSDVASTLTFQVTNVSDLFLANNPNSVFKVLGVGTNGSEAGPISIGTTSSLFTTACNYFISGCADATSNPSAFSGAGFAATNFFGLEALPPPPADGLQDEQTVSFFLTFTNSQDATNFLKLTDNFQFALQDISGPTGTCGSSKAVFGSDGTATSASSSPTSVGSCITATPEPGSAVLLVTGLAGLVGVVRRRRAFSGFAV